MKTTARQLQRSRNDRERRKGSTGRTTRMILKIINMAMYHPGQSIVITDHDNTPKNIKLNVVPKMREYIARLQLKGFTIKRESNYYVLIFDNPLTN